jgi:hypothetical protein
MLRSLQAIHQILPFRQIPGFYIIIQHSYAIVDFHTEVVHMRISSYNP